MPRVIIDASDQAQRDMLRWAAAHMDGIPEEYFQNPLCFGISNDAETEFWGVVIFHDLRRHPVTGEAIMVEMSAASITSRWLSRGVLRFLFGYVFHQLGCRRLNTVTPASNEAACRVDEKLGFVQEGTIREGHPSGCDVLLFGMLARECRWIDEGGLNGQEGCIQRAGNA